ncbi:MAG TPA: hypothetical protein VGI43_01390 [Mucilaginibacter sp.]|jgi:hypothetical protein
MISTFRKLSITAGLFFLALLPLLVQAQYTQIIAGPSITPAVNFIYVGSLTNDPNSAGNCQKMRVSVLGGTWGAGNIGETIYYIANRGGLSINQVVTGGSGVSNTILRVFQNGATNYDLYLQINYQTGYYSMAVWSYNMAGYQATAQNVTITTSANTPPGTDITSTAAYIPVMTTDASGNIAVNSINPNGYKLAVKGTIHAQQVNVDMNNWADYVFDKDYPLPSLTDIKTYIDQNHHLPEIPSAQQVEKEGLNLGEMNKVLVKKVEELTLYLIEEDKEIKVQDAQFNDQQKIDQTLRKEVQTQQQEIDELKKQVSILIKRSNKK